MELTLDQKFAKSIVKLSALRPFYSAIYEAMPHTENNSIKTMAVTGRELLYNRKFVERLTFPEFMFVTLHEICHVALMHVPRIQNRDPEIFNVACDLYVNRILAQEFRLDPGDTTEDGLVTFGTGALYCSSIDIDYEDVEHIYDELWKQALKNGYTNDVSGIYHFTYTGKGDSYDKWKTFELDIDKRVFEMDLMSDGVDPSELDSECKRILADAKIKTDMQNKGNGVGSSSGILGKLVTSLLKSHVDWRKLLRKYLITLTSKDVSYAMPDKRMCYQRAIYPGNMSISETALERVKLCFDCSGSISVDDARHFWGQAKQLLDTYKTDAEIVNWDTEVIGTSALNDPHFMSKAHILMGGGTNPSCVFRYFDSKLCKVKPYVTIIFTDGWISFNDNPRWHKKYKRTIWVLTKEHCDTFKPPFGIVALAKFDT